VRAFARTDEEIAHEIRDQVALQEALGLDNGTLDVEVHGGETTIAGNVRTRTGGDSAEARCKGAGRRQCPLGSDLDRRRLVARGHDTAADSITSANGRRRVGRAAWAG
jgi:hypothetical protein